MPAANGTLILRSDDVLEILRRVGLTFVMGEVIARLREHLVDTESGSRRLSPLREGFPSGIDGEGITEWMPHHDNGAITVKLVSYSPRNPETRNLPTILGHVARIDSATGQLIALCDGGVLTAIRTGAASAIATGLLASPDSRTIGLIGLGAQAVTQLHALTQVVSPSMVLVFDIDSSRMASFVHRANFTEARIEPASPSAVLHLSDVISTATSVAIGEGPVFPDGGHVEHLHINAVGSDVVGKTELPFSLVERAVVCADHPTQALREGESQRLRPEELGPSLAELSARPDLHTHLRSVTTVFDSTGFALEDHAALDVLLDLAADLNIGTRIDLQHIPADAYNPYSGCIGSHRFTKTRLA